MTLHLSRTIAKVSDGAARQLHRLLSSHVSGLISNVPMTGLLATVLMAAIWTGGCSDADQARGICLLIDTAGAGQLTRQNARLLTHRMLGMLQSDDTLAIIDINRAAADRDRMIAGITFGIRPMTVNRQKRAIAASIADAVAAENSTPSHQDLFGSMVQAVEYLNDVDSARKFILIYSDLMKNRKEEDKQGTALHMAGCQVIAIDVAELQGDAFDLRQYLKRLALWQQRVETGGGKWRLISDYGALERMLRSP